MTDNMQVHSIPRQGHEHRAEVLTVDDVTIGYQQGDQWLNAVRDVSLTVRAGESYGLVGESGSGKSTLALAVMHYLSGNGRVRKGKIRLLGQDLTTVDESTIRTLWAQQVKMVPQNALSSLNPSLRIGVQVAECLDPGSRGHGTRQRVLELLALVRLSDPERVANSYPHELSGGMQQRVMIAMALGVEPELLVLDEPTTSLDVTTEAAILDLVNDLIEQRQTSVLFVSHNLGVVAQTCDRVAVLYAGELVEDAGVEGLFAQPLHPYTFGLLASMPVLGQSKYAGQLMPIPGSIPNLDEVPSGCIFAPRCPVALEKCHNERPSLDAPVAGRTVRCHRWPEIMSGELDLESETQRAVDTAETLEARPEIALSTTDARGKQQVADASKQRANGEEPVLTVERVEKRFRLARSVGELLRGQPIREVRAVDGVSLTIRPGRTLGLVGESGSGKTTLARCIIGLAERSSGEMELLSIPLARSLGERDRAVLHQLQMVFQNPDEALNPYMTVGETLRRPLLRLAGAESTIVEERVHQLLEMVRLRPEYATRLPAQLSGGEKQRIAVARAFAAQPELLIFDESVSALDVSVQASILNLLNELQVTTQSAYLFITHDLGVVSYIADDIAVIYLGRLMEVGQSTAFFAPPYHPYTEALLSSIPVPIPGSRGTQIRLDGEVPSPVNIPSGCPFHTRCPRYLGEICRTETPPWREDAQGHRIFCHIELEELRRLQKPVVGV